MSQCPGSLRCYILTVIVIIMAGLTVSSAFAEEEDLKKNKKIYITSDKLITDSEAKCAEFIGNVRAVQENTIITADSLKIFYKKKALGEHGSVKNYVLISNMMLREESSAGSDIIQEMKKDEEFQILDQYKHNDSTCWYFIKIKSGLTGWICGVYRGEFMFKEKVKNNTSISDDESIEKIVSSGNVKINFDDKVAVAQHAVYTSETGVLVLTGPNSKVTSGTNFVSGEKITLYRSEDRMTVESSDKERVEAIFYSEEGIE